LNSIQVLEFFDVFSMILKAASCASATDYYTKVYVQTIGPLAALGLLFLAFARTGQSYFFDLLLFVSFVVYPSSSATLIQFFDCYTAWHGESPEGTSYLLSDPSIKCTDDKYLVFSMFYVLPMTAVVVVGFPAYYAKLVWSDRKFIKPKCPNAWAISQLKIMQNQVIASKEALHLVLGDYLGLYLSDAELELLFSHWARPAGSTTQALVKYDKVVKLLEFGEQHDKWSKECHLARLHGTACNDKAALPEPILEDYNTVPSVVHDQIQAHAIRAHTAASTRSKDVRERWVMHAREGDERAQRSAFLWKAYRPKYYWCEVFDMFRKFLLTGLPLILNSLFPNSSQLSLAVGLLASMLGMITYAAASPFADQQDSLLMLPAQMQVTLTMVCGMLMTFAAGDPASEMVISLLVILTFAPVMVFGFYLLWNPDFDLASYLTGSLVVKFLQPFLGENRKQSAEAVQLAVELVMNPNLDAHDDIVRLGGGDAELVLDIVEVVQPVVEVGSPDQDDITGMVEDLLAICSRSANSVAAKHSGPFVEKMALTALALAGVSLDHPIVKQVKSKLGLIEDFSDLYDAIKPIAMAHGDIFSIGGIMDVLESLGLSPQVVAQALLPALCHKALLLAGVTPKEASKWQQEIGTLDIPNWDQSRIDEAKSTISDCLDGDITEEDFKMLLQVSGATKERAVVMAEMRALRLAFEAVLPGHDSRAMVNRALANVDVGGPVTQLGLRRACINENTRQAKVFELLLLVGEPFGKVAARIVQPMVLKTLMHAGFRADSELVAMAMERARKQVQGSKDPLDAKAWEGVLADSKVELDNGALQSLLAGLDITVDALLKINSTTRPEVRKTGNKFFKLKAKQPPVLVSKAESRTFNSAQELIADRRKHRTMI
jgi:hypothetical protein